MAVTPAILLVVVLIDDRKTFVCQPAHYLSAGRVVVIAGGISFHDLTSNGRNAVAYESLELGPRAVVRPPRR